jgi:hypothetical protein
MATLFTWKDDSGATESARFDIITSEGHEAIMAITDHPVEEGANVVDHARAEPVKISIEAYVSNKPIFSNPDVEKTHNYETVDLDIPEKTGGAPIFTPGGLTQGVTAGIGGLFGEPQNRALVLRASSPVDRVHDLYSKLKAAQLARRQITIETKLDVYVDMLIERLAVPRTPEDGNGAVFQMDLRQVRFVKSETVQAPEPTEKRGAVKASKGSKAGEEEKNPEKEEKMKSILKGVKDEAKSLAGALF